MNYQASKTYHEWRWVFAPVRKTNDQGRTVALAYAVRKIQWVWGDYLCMFAPASQNFNCMSCRQVYRRHSQTKQDPQIQKPLWPLHCADQSRQLGQNASLKSTMRPNRNLQQMAVTWSKDWNWHGEITTFTSASSSFKDYVFQRRFCALGTVIGWSIQRVFHSRLVET